MGFNSSTPSWQTLGHLRRRGQRPATMLFVTDDWRFRGNLEANGFFAVPLPGERECIFAAGLEVVLIAEPTEHAIAIAQLLAAASPQSFVTRFRGRDAQRVL